VQPRFGGILPDHMALPYDEMVLRPDALHVYIDRTALEWYWQCPRKFYWGRRHASFKAVTVDGKPILGLEPQANEHRVFGKLMHKLVEVATSKLPTLPNPTELGTAVLPLVMQDMAAASVAPHVLKEYTGLGMGLAHQLVTHILPVLLQDHEIIAVEEELLIPLPYTWGHGLNKLGQLVHLQDPAKVQLVIRVKPDLVLRHKADGQVVYFEWKTTSFTGTDQLAAFEINPQIQLGLLAARLKYGHAEWAQVGLFYKGQKRNNQRTSPFCYGYVCADGRLSTRYVKGWHKQPLVDILMEQEQDMNWWVKQMDDEQEQGQFWVTPPLMPNAVQHEAFVDQLRGLVPRILSIEQDDYPQSFVQCNGPFGKTCDYYGACYMGQQDTTYVARIPHHDPMPIILYNKKGHALSAAV